MEACIIMTKFYNLVNVQRRLNLPCYSQFAHALSIIIHLFLLMFECARKVELSLLFSPCTYCHSLAMGGDSCDIG